MQMKTPHVFATVHIYSNSSFTEIIITIAEKIVRWRSIFFFLIPCLRSMLAAVSINLAIYARLLSFLRSAQVSANAFGYCRGVLRNARSTIHHDYRDRRRSNFAIVREEFRAICKSSLFYHYFVHSKCVFDASINKNIFYQSLINFIN